MFAIRSNRRQVGVAFCSVCVLAMSVNVVRGVVVQVLAVRVNEKPIARTPYLAVIPGDQIDLEFYASDWGDEIDTVRMWQIEVDVEGYFSGSDGALMPLGWDAPFSGRTCQADDDCGGGVCFQSHTCGREFCSTDVDCVAPFICSELYTTKQCLGAHHDPPSGAFIDEGHTEYIFDGVFPVVSAVSTAFLSYRYGALVFIGDGPVDDGGMCYLCTLRLVVSDDARGVFTVGAAEHPYTFVADSRFIDASLVMDPVVIEVATDAVLELGACCRGRFDCEDLTQSECAESDGLWQGGQVCGVDTQSCLKARRPRETSQD